MEQENIIKNFIGKNSDVIYGKMNKKGSFNIYSMLFTSMYFLYRKMYLIGIISFVLQSLIAEFVNNIFISLACFVIWGFAFYPLYKMHVNRKIKKLTAKEFAEEDIKRKGGTSIGAAIIIPGILVVILLASMGIKIMNSALENIDNNDDNTTTNTSKYYSYNGAKIEYGNGWELGYLETGEQEYKALVKKDGNIVIACLEVFNIDDGISNYSLENTRKEYYNEWINIMSSVYSDNDITISKQSNEFIKISNNLYYAYYEINIDKNVREYLILNTSNNTVASFTLGYEKSITNEEEKEIIKMFETIEF